MMVLLERRLWASLVQVLFSVIFVCSLSRGSTATRRPRIPDSCPVRLRSNNTAETCTCSSSTVNEIGCSGGLDAVPEFLPSDRVFQALYLSKQNISEVIQGSFTNLQVSFLLKILKQFVLCIHVYT